MMAPTAWRPSGRNPSLQSNPSACIAFTISNATGKLSIVAARCDMGVLLLWAWQPQLEYPFLPLTQNLLRHRHASRYRQGLREDGAYESREMHTERDVEHRDASRRQLQLRLCPERVGHLSLRGAESRIGGRHLGHDHEQWRQDDEHEKRHAGQVARRRLRRCEAA